MGRNLAWNSYPKSPAAASTPLGVTWEGATTSSSLDSAVVSSTRASLLEGAGPSLRAARATWGPLSSSSLPEELPLLSLLSSEVLEALALGRPEGVVMARWTVGTAGFLSLLVPLACAGALWGLVTGSVPRALPI